MCECLKTLPQCLVLRQILDEEPWHAPNTDLSITIPRTTITVTDGITNKYNTIRDV